MAQVKSRPSLKIVEYDVFIRVIPISRQIDTIEESMMFIVTMSMLRPPRAGPRAPLRARGDITASPPA